jgi:tetratricopeptide (TPR) repeat protein
MHAKSACFLLIVLGLTTSTACGRKISAPNAPSGNAPAASKAAQGKAGPTDSELLEQVSQRLRVVMDPLPGRVAPPAFEIVKEDGINAYATAKVEEGAQGVRLLPQVVVFQGLLDHVVRAEDDPDGDADRLALIVSHELGHVILAHVVRPPAGQTEFVRQAFNRKQEIDADLKGMELALKAGYSFRRGRGVIDRMRDLGLTYSSFEGLGVSHPSWNDRLTHMDKDQAKLWKAMSAFQNGVFFLLFEQYASAESCFRAVIREFPQCYEAWTNLGDSLLMQYCDKLETDDVRRLNVGQMAVGGFYARPESLEGMVRGMDKTLWNDAVEALGKALALKPDLPLAKANLGVAYLVSPHGQDLDRATSYLDQVVRDATPDRAVPPLVRAAVLVNAGAADLSSGRSAAAARRLDAAEAIARELAGKLPKIPMTSTLGCGLLYNRALLLAASPDKAQRRQAAVLFEQYLAAADPSSTWWPLAQERYAGLCRDLGLEARTKEALAHRRPNLRLLTSVKLNSGARVALSEPVSEVRQRLGQGHEVPVVRGTDLVRVYYPEQGIELLCREQVLAICLRGPKAPPLPLQSVGPGGPACELRVGMKKAELEKALANQPYDVRQLDDPKVSYVYYPILGLAVRWHAGDVEELVVAQIPRRVVFGPTDEEYAPGTGR